MQLRKYFKELPNQWSANYLAVVGVVNFLYAAVGAITTYIQILIGNNYTELKNIPYLFLSVIVYFVPVTCLLAIIPCFVVFKFLTQINSQVKKQLYILLLIIFLCVNPYLSAFNFDIGGSIFFVFIPLFGYPIIILVFIIYFILLLIDFINQKKISNKSLIENKYYKIFINVFYWYFITLTPIIVVAYKRIIIPSF